MEFGRSRRGKQGQVRSQPRGFFGTWKRCVFPQLKKVKQPAIFSSVNLIDLILQGCETTTEYQKDVKPLRISAPTGMLTQVDKRLSMFVQVVPDR